MSQPRTSIPTTQQNSTAPRPPTTTTTVAVDNSGFDRSVSDSDSESETHAQASHRMRMDVFQGKFIEFRDGRIWWKRMATRLWVLALIGSLISSVCMLLVLGYDNKEYVIAASIFQMIASVMAHFQQTAIKNEELYDAQLRDHIGDQKKSDIQSMRPYA